jgi:hypothetical protein
MFRVDSSQRHLVDAWVVEHERLNQLTICLFFVVALETTWNS